MPSYFITPFPFPKCLVLFPRFFYLLSSDLQLSFSPVLLRTSIFPAILSLALLHHFIPLPSFQCLFLLRPMSLVYGRYVLAWVRSREYDFSGSISLLLSPTCVQIEILKNVPLLMPNYIMASCYYPL